MKIAIASVQIPFITGGAELLAEMLKEALKKRGHDAEIVTIPFKWYPAKTLLNCMVMSRMVDLTEVNGEKIDLLIALKFPAYYIQHPNKVLWVLHQHRQAYELWDTEFGDLKSMDYGKETRERIISCDNQYMKEAKKIFTISNLVTERLEKFNEIDALTLYPPPKEYEKIKEGNFEDYIFYPSRIDSMKRQRLLVEAAKYIKSPVKIMLAGSGSKNEISEIQNIIKSHGTSEKVSLLGYIDDDKKRDLYSNCLGVYFGAYQEDYGYVTLEAFYSGKPVITHPDAGGPLEFVNEENGFIVDADPKLIAQKIDFLHKNKETAKAMGSKGRRLMQELDITWDHAIEELIN